MVSKFPRGFSLPFFSLRQNYLFSKNAIIEIIYETLGKKTKNEIENDLNWDLIAEGTEKSLINLFIEFAVINKVDKSIKTVKTGINNLFLSYHNDEYILSDEKIETLINQKKYELIKKNINRYDKLSNEYNVVKRTTLEHVQSIEKKIDIISGKDFLFPILQRVLTKFVRNANITTDSFKLRLMRHCNKNDFMPLKLAIESSVRRSVS